MNRITGNGAMKHNLAEHAKWYSDNVADHKVIFGYGLDADIWHTPDLSSGPLWSAQTAAVKSFAQLGSVLTSLENRTPPTLPGVSSFDPKCPPVAVLQQHENPPPTLRSEDKPPCHFPSHEQIAAAPNFNASFPQQQTLYPSTNSNWTKSADFSSDNGLWNGANVESISYGDNKPPPSNRSNLLHSAALSFNATSHSSFGDFPPPADHFGNLDSFSTSGGGEGCYDHNQNSSSAAERTSRFRVTSEDYDPRQCSSVALNEVDHAWDTGTFPWDADVDRVNRDIFGNSQFRPKQRAIINAVLSQRDVFAMMPTGGGKSLCFQLPALISGGITVAVMPLIALMQDQVEQMRSLNIECRHLLGTQDWEDQRRIYDDLRDISLGVRILYVTPEKLKGSQALLSSLHELNRGGRLDRFAIDEAHCVSQWGNDFRPDYIQLKRLREDFPNVPLVGLTATATQTVLQDVLNQLGMRSVLIFQRSFDRPNLQYEIKAKSKRTIAQDVAQEIRNRFPRKCGIVYCLSKIECEKVADALNSAGLSARYYHGDVRPSERESTQYAWMNDDINIMVATIAFGMGINKPDVRFVIHTSLPKCLENFYQESGRAGRDGQKAFCLLYYDYNDKHRQQMLQQSDHSNNNADRKRRQEEHLLSIVEFCEEQSVCRRKHLLKHFGETFLGKCAVECDNCRRVKGPILPVTRRCADEVRMAVEFIRASLSASSIRGKGNNKWRSKGISLTLSSLRDALLGVGATSKKGDAGVQQCPGFSCLKGKWNTEELNKLLRQLVIRKVINENVSQQNRQFKGIVAYIGLGPNSNIPMRNIPTSITFFPTSGSSNNANTASATQRPQAGAGGRPPTAERSKGGAKGAKKRVPPTKKLTAAQLRAAGHGNQQPVAMPSSPTPPSPTRSYSQSSSFATSPPLGQGEARKRQLTSESAVGVPRDSSSGAAAEEQDNRAANSKRRKVRGDKASGSGRSSLPTGGPSSAAGGVGGREDRLPHGLQEKLRGVLIGVRKGLAEKNHVAYVKNIITNDGLNTLSRTVPTTMDALAKLCIPGFTAKQKREKYGQFFLESICDFLNDNSRDELIAIPHQRRRTVGSGDPLAAATGANPLPHESEEYVTVGGGFGNAPPQAVGVYGGATSSGVRGGGGEWNVNFDEFAFAGERNGSQAGAHERSLQNATAAQHEQNFTAVADDSGGLFAGLEDFDFDELMMC